MELSPPFEMEDQTDEDFFDKLVDDDDEEEEDFGVVALSKKVSGLGLKLGGENVRELDEARVMSELSKGDENVSGLDEARVFSELSKGGEGDGKTVFEVDSVGLDKGVGEMEFVELAGKFRDDVNKFDNDDKGGVMVSDLAGKFRGDVNKLDNDDNGVVTVSDLAAEISDDVGVLDNGDKGVVMVSDLAAEISDDVGILDNGDKGVVMVSDLAAEISDDVGILDNGDKGTVMEADLAASKGDTLGNSGIKELQWSAFSSDVLQNGVSDTDIFGEFGDREKTEESLVCESNVIYGSDGHKSAYLDGSQSYGQYQEGQVNAAEAVYSADGQDVNSTEYWENLYPGWKYDQNTGQWYQVNGYVANTSVEGSFDTNVRNDTTEVSYLQQTSQSGVGTVAQSGTNESVTNWNQTSRMGEATEMAPNWNQVSQTTDSTESVSTWDQVPISNNGYPSHMYFDPQYPGWYYDTISQEWHSLDTYIASTQSAVQSANHLNQNGFASISTSQIDDQKTLGGYGQVGNYVAGGFSHQSQNYNWSGSFNNYNQQDSNMWQPSSAGSGFQVNEKLAHQYDQNHSLNNQVSQQNSYDHKGSVPYNEKASQSLNEFSTISEHQSFVSGGNLTPQLYQPQFNKTEQMHTSYNYYDNQNVSSYSQQQYQGENQFSYASAAGRSPDGRPPHALVSFGFGGKLISMKDSNSSLGNSSYGGQVPVGGRSISVLNLMEVVSERPDAINTRPGVCEYFNNLCRQSIPGPLTGGNVSAKELYRWTDERIANCESPDIDYRKGEVLRLLLSLLKIALQHYGKLRSPFGTDKVLKETVSPESEVARLFASSKGNGSDSSNYGALAPCLQKLPSEAKMQATAAEVQTLLVSGRKKEALISAQEGHLWGPALVLAAQLGDQFYVDTVKQMALHQLVPGSPLRTLCLLIAGQPAEVFSAESGANGINSNTQLGANGMLDDWEENLAVITANRTKDDELVLIHLGDCLWKERSEIVAAHICYLVAEANFEPYSDSARLCLLGADHFKFPRTYASPEAIQRTEIYEYSKLLGNSQFTLLPFQPYKLVYAHMLAEVGRVSDSLKYCQAVLKSLKTGRVPEVETWRHLASSLEERIKTHQQGGFSTNLAPAKLVGKLLNLFDSTASRVVGSLPSPASSTTAGSIQGNGHSNQSSGPRVMTSQSTMAMSSLIPSDSMESINEWTADGNRMTMHNRSASEPDFSRTPRQDQTNSSKEVSSTNTQSKASASGEASRLSRFGSQFIQKILKPRQEKQAKLGETNKFYYDEKLKRWVEEGVAPPAEEAALPPPPTTAAFPNGTSDYNLNSALKNEGPRSNGSPERSLTSLVHSSGIPPIPPTSNQFSARGRMGVRSRYVDTFNKGGGNQTNMFQSPSVPSVKAKSNASPNFFVPALASGQTLNSAADGNQQTTSGNYSSISDSVQSFAQPSSTNMQRFASMDDISKKRTAATPGMGNGSLPHCRRTASWSGSIAKSFGPPSDTETNPLGEVLGIPPSLFMPTSPALVHSSANGGSYGDDLHEVEL